MEVRVRLYSDPREVFTAPFADTVETLFDGTHDMAVIGQALPARPADLFTPRALAQIAAPSGRLAQALRANDVCRSRPAAPVRLYAAHGDQDVVFAHAERCRDQTAAHQGQVELVDLGGTDHVGTAIAGLPLTRDWFQQMRAGDRLPVVRVREPPNGTAVLGPLGAARACAGVRMTARPSAAGSWRT